MSQVQKTLFQKNFQPNSSRDFYSGARGILGCILLACGSIGIAEPASSCHAQSTKAETTHSNDDPIVDLVRGMPATSQAFRNAVNQIRPSLVTIESFGGASTVHGRIGGIQKQGEGATTGLVISADGYLLTSTFSFIQQQPVITVITHDGIRRVARIVGQDETRKVCLLKIEAVSDLPVPRIAKLDEMQVGQWTVSVGVGYGDAVPAISKGILSAKNRIGGKAIQTDARTSPANYGGPLLDKRGQVMGICVPLDPMSSAVGAGVEWYDSGIGFAIPLDQSETWIARLKKGETIRPPYLGIKAQPNPDGRGLWIEHAAANSPAQKANLEAGDVILEVDNQPVDDLQRLRQIFNGFEAGQSIRLKVLKGGQGDPIEFKLKLEVVPKRKKGDNPMAPPQIR